jgi:hypothetical protein
MALLTEEIINETETTLTIKFSRSNGASLTKEVKKVEGMSNEDIMSRWHRRMTIEYLQRPFKFKKEATQ